MDLKKYTLLHEAMQKQAFLAPLIRGASNLLGKGVGWLGNQLGANGTWLRTFGKTLQAPAKQHAKLLANVDSRKAQLVQQYVNQGFTPQQAETLANTVGKQVINAGPKNVGTSWQKAVADQRTQLNAATAPGKAPTDIYNTVNPVQPNRLSEFAWGTAPLLATMGGMHLIDSATSGGHGPQQPQQPQPYQYSERQASVQNFFNKEANPYTRRLLEQAVKGRKQQPITNNKTPATTGSNSKLPQEPRPRNKTEPAVKQPDKPVETPVPAMEIPNRPVKPELPAGRAVPMPEVNPYANPRLRLDSFNYPTVNTKINSPAINPLLLTGLGLGVGAGGAYGLGSYLNSAEPQVATKKSSFQNFFSKDAVTGRELNRTVMAKGVRGGGKRAPIVREEPKTTPKQDRSKPEKPQRRPQETPAEPAPVAPAPVAPAPVADLNMDNLVPPAGLPVPSAGNINPLLLGGLGVGGVGLTGGLGYGLYNYLNSDIPKKSIKTSAAGEQPKAPTKNPWSKQLKAVSAYSPYALPAFAAGDALLSSNSLGEGLVRGTGYGAGAYIGGEFGKSLGGDVSKTNSILAGKKPTVAKQLPAQLIGQTVGQLSGLLGTRLLMGPGSQPAKRAAATRSPRSRKTPSELKDALNNNLTDLSSAALVGIPTVAAGSLSEMGPGLYNEGFSGIPSTLGRTAGTGALTALGAIAGGTKTHFLADVLKLKGGARFGTVGAGIAGGGYLGYRGAQSLLGQPGYRQPAPKQANVTIDDLLIPGAGAAIGGTIGATRGAPLEGMLRGTAYGSGIGLGSLLGAGVGDTVGRLTGENNGLAGQLVGLPVGGALGYYLTKKLLKKPSWETETRDNNKKKKHRG